MTNCKSEAKVLSKTEYIKIISSLKWRVNQTILLKVYKGPIRTKLDFGCTIYKSGSVTTYGASMSFIIQRWGRFLTSTSSSISSLLGDQAWYFIRNNVNSGHASSQSGGGDKEKLFSWCEYPNLKSNSNIQKKKKKQCLNEKGLDLP